MRAIREQNGGAYKSWSSMKDRCANPGHIGWENYGGRGITVCAGLMDYEDFVAVMGDRPKGTSIDRIDNDGGYWCGSCEECKGSGRPKNVRWATRHEQLTNTRRSGSRQSRFPGVWNEGGRWRSGIKVDGKHIHAGSFLTEEEAAYALDRYAEANQLDVTLYGVTGAQALAAGRSARRAVPHAACRKCGKTIEPHRGRGRPRKDCLDCRPPAASSQDRPRHRIVTGRPQRSS
jgi:hypothetical protein